MEPITCMIIGGLIGSGVQYFFGESEKDRLRRKLIEMEAQMAEQEARLRAASEEKHRLELERFQLVLKFYAERIRVLSQQESVSYDRALRLHVVVLHLQKLHTEGGNPLTMSTDDARFFASLRALMDSKAISPQEFAWFNAYVMDQHPDAATAFLLERFAAQVRSNATRAMAMRRELDKQTREAKILRLQAEIENDSSILRRADALDARNGIIAADIAARTEQDDDLRRNLVIVHRVARRGARLNEDDHAAFRIVQRLAGLAGESQSDLTEPERLFLDSYRAMYEVQVRDEIQDTLQLDIT